MVETTASTNGTADVRLIPHNPEASMSVQFFGSSHRPFVLLSLPTSCSYQPQTPLTGHPNNPDPFGEQVRVYPFNFNQPDKLVESLRGATTLYNIYWVRFSHGSTTYEQAVANTKVLFQAAKEAGVQRIVHVSITNPDETSPLPYFTGG